MQLTVTENAACLSLDSTVTVTEKRMTKPPRRKAHIAREEFHSRILFIFCTSSSWSEAIVPPRGYRLSTVEPEHKESADEFIIVQLTYSLREYSIKVDETVVLFHCFQVLDHVFVDEALEQNFGNFEAVACALCGSLCAR